MALEPATSGVTGRRAVVEGVEAREHGANTKQCCPLVTRRVTEIRMERHPRGHGMTQLDTASVTRNEGSPVRVRASA